MKPLRTAWNGLAPQGALERSTDPQDRALLAPPDGRRGGGRDRAGALRRWWRSVRDPSLERFDSVIGVVELELRHAATPNPGAVAALEAARAARATGNAEAAWMCVKLAQRLSVLSADQEHLAAVTGALEREAPRKLSSWRAATVEWLVKEEDQAADGVGDASPDLDLQRRRMRLYQAMRIRDEGTDNDYRRLDLVRRNRDLLLPALLGTVIVLAVCVGTGTIVLDPPNRDTGRFFVAVALFGTLGACISALQSLGGAAKDRMPEAMTSATMTLTRPVIGAGAGMASYVIARGGFLQLDADTGHVHLAIAFAAGFSERLIVRLVDAAGRK